MKKKIVITNAVPTNNGDAALIFGVYNRLMVDGYDVSISTVNYQTVKKLYPQINWSKDKLDNKFIRKIKKINLPIYTYMAKKDKKFNNVDAVISAPGGYINSYYGFTEKLHYLSKIKKSNNNKLIMYSQSVGPLNDSDKLVLKKYINNFDCFMVRDKESYENVKNYNNILRTNDAAFLLDIIRKKETNSNKVAISVRAWSQDGRNATTYIKLIKEMVYMCVKNNYQVEFLSTCQGLPNYIDDSKMAMKIYNELSDDVKSFVTVNDKYYDLFELRKYLTTFNFTIGTRLHMCILSLLSSTPAFNISYEVKGRECYNILELPQYSIDYNANIEESLVKLNDFISNIDNLKKVFLNKTEIMHEEAVKYYEKIKKDVIEN